VARCGVCGVGAAIVVKIALLGGGGFRTPMVYESLADATSDVAIDELVLFDVDADRLARMAAVIEGLDRQGGRPAISLRTSTSIEDAVEGCEAVFAAVRVGGLAARVVDEQVPLELGVLGQETVGPAGVAFALRTVPEMLRLAHVVRARAPHAWFVNFTNPAGLVTEAMRSVLGERAIGICDSPTALWRHVASALGRTRAALRPSYAGLNHLGWLTAMWDEDVDLLPSLLRDSRIERVHEARLAGLDDVRRRGIIPNEYLAYYAATAEVIGSFRRHGARSEILARQQSAFYDTKVSTPEDALAGWRRAKDARHGTYMAETRDVDHVATSDPTPDDDVMSADEAGYGGVAAAFVRAVTNGTGERLVLGVRNGRTLAWLDDDATVEVPCVVAKDGPRADEAGDLRDEERTLMQRVREAERATLEAASSSSRDAVVNAVACHPVVPSRELAERIVDGYVERHGWMREHYA
jgi:6-phospho-beta-glucosidase